MRISDGSSDVCSSDLPIGDRAGLAGVGQSINRPLDMLIFFGERSASAIGDFPYPLERQDGRIIVNAELCRRIVVARHDVRFLDARAALQFTCQPAYAAVSLIFDFRPPKRNLEPHMFFHSVFPLPLTPP